MGLQRILNTPSRGPSSEVPHTPLILPPSQATTQSWDSQNGPCPGTSVQVTQDSQSSQSSQSTQPTDGSPPSTPTRRNLETLRDLSCEWEERSCLILGKVWGNSTNYDEKVLSYIPKIPSRAC